MLCVNVPDVIATVAPDTMLTVFSTTFVPLVPTVKVCGNPATVRDWADAVDVDISGIVDGRLTLADAVDALQQVADGADIVFAAGDADLQQGHGGFQGR